VAETGAFDRFSYTEAQIALTAASHSGEAAHVAEVDAVLEKLGLTENHLFCEPAYPAYGTRRDEMIRNGQPPTRRHHNCSGKHCGMLAAALTQGEPTEGYWKLDHPHQQRILRAFAELGDIAADRILMGVDGCGVPVHALPLRNVALAYARLADPSALSSVRRGGCWRVTSAMVRYPYLLGGSERFDTVLIAVGGGRWFCKGGALGYFAAGVFPREGATPALGIALKIEDGSHPVSCQTAVEVLLQLGLLDKQQHLRLAPWHYVTSKNYLGEVVGFSQPELELMF
jgi:L-asparaginase II